MRWSILIKKTLTADVVIIGSGMGGGTLAWALKDTGLDVLIIERGQFLPREPENSQPDHVFIKKRYVTSAPWYDAKTGQPFQPGAYYWVGGNTKMYGACLPRFRRSDFHERAHHDGVSPAWPFSYDDLEPFYAKAEELYQVHGAIGEDPTEPEHSTPYPYPPLSHEPEIERLAVRLRQQGLHPFHMANGMHLPSMVERRADATADGSPSVYRQQERCRESGSQARPGVTVGAAATGRVRTPVAYQHRWLTLSPRPKRT